MTDTDTDIVIKALAVINTGDNPYVLRSLPPKPGEEQRTEDGYGLLMPNAPNQQAETDKHPEFHSKTDLTRDPDYGQGPTMDVGINV